MDNFHPIYFLILSMLINVIVQLYTKIIHKFSFLGSIKAGFLISSIVLFYLCYNDNVLNLLVKIEIIFLFLLGNYCYIIIINTPESSVRLKILFLINKNKMTKKKLLQIYNNNEMFNIRIKKLISSKTIGIKNKNLFIINKKIIILFYLFRFLKKIYLGNSLKV